MIMPSKHLNIPLPLYQSAATRNIVLINPKCSASLPVGQIREGRGLRQTIVTINGPLARSLLRARGPREDAPIITGDTVHCRHDQGQFIVSVPPGRYPFLTSNPPNFYPTGTAHLIIPRIPKVDRHHRRPKH